jgi:hypothetical protein
MLFACCFVCFGGFLCILMPGIGLQCAYHTWELDQIGRPGVVWTRQANAWHKDLLYILC